MFTICQMLRFLSGVMCGWTSSRHATVSAGPGRLGFGIRSAFIECLREKTISFQRLIGSLV